MKFNQLTVTLFCSAFLVACAGMPISSMLKLRNLEPLEMDPSQIKIAVLTDKAIKLAPDSTSLTLGFSSDVASAAFSSESIATIINQANVAELNAEKSDGQDITLFYLASEAAAKMRDAQNRIKVIRQQEIEGEGSLSVGVTSGCIDSQRPDQLLASIFVQFSEAQGFVEMQSDIDLLQKTGDQPFWVEC